VFVALHHWNSCAGLNALVRPTSIAQDIVSNLRYDSIKGNTITITLELRPARKFKVGKTILR